MKTSLAADEHKHRSAFIRVHPWQESVFSRLLCSTLLVAALPAAHAQFALSVVTGTGETPVTSQYDFGTVSAGDVATAHFRLRNTGNTPAIITLLSVAGAGFTLPVKPALPLTLSAQGSSDFTVAFQGSSTGGYSAALSTDGLSVLLTAAVVPGLTYEIQTASGTQPLGAAPIDFGFGPGGPSGNPTCSGKQPHSADAGRATDQRGHKRFQPFRRIALGNIHATGAASGI